MKRLVAFILLLVFPLFALGQPKINRRVAGFLLGKQYSVTKVQKIIENKYQHLSRSFTESNSSLVMAIGSIPFAGEDWECLMVKMESKGKVAEITLGNSFSTLEDAKSFFLRVSEIIVAKYGKPVINHLEDALECVWEDQVHTQLSLQLNLNNDPEDSLVCNVWLSYEDELLVQKIRSDIINEL